MHSFAFAVYFTIVIIIYFIIPISNATPSVDDEMLITFLRNDQKMQISEYSMQKYGAHLGIVYYMRKNWQCEKIGDEFEEYERTECQKYRKYLDILYEYMFLEYVGMPTVKPKFAFKKKQIEINGPIIYAVNYLTKISQFYFNKGFAAINYELKLNKLFPFHYEPKLLNEQRMDYGLKLGMPINEMILQMAIDMSYKCQTNESAEGIIRQNFDKNLEEMLKKAEERAKRGQRSSSFYEYEVFDTHKIIAESIFDDYYFWTDDALFTAYVKGQATNFEKFYTLIKQYSVFEKSKQKFEAYLGLVYLMRKNWQCAKNGKDFGEKCQKYKKYLHILYEYLFRMYAEVKKPNMANQLPAVKPIFKISSENVQIMIKLISVIQNLNEISKYFWKNGENELEICFGTWEMELQNEIETIEGIEEEENNGQKSERKSKKQSTEIGKLRTEFDQKMEKIFENAKKKSEAEEKAKLEKALAKSANNLEIKINMENEFEEKFGPFNTSPFA